MQRLGIPFVVIAPVGVEEIQVGTPRKVVTRNASAKASEVVAGLNEGLVVGADTVAAIDDTILGKAESPREAREMLEALRGRMHRILTGLAVIDVETGRRDVDIVVTKVWIHPVSDDEIWSYVSSGEGRRLRHPRSRECARGEGRGLL